MAHGLNGLLPIQRIEGTLMSDNNKIKIDYSGSGWGDPTVLNPRRSINIFRLHSMVKNGLKFEKVDEWLKSITIEST